MEIEGKKGLIIQSLRKTLGNITQACEDAGIARSEFYRYVREDDDFGALVESVREEMIDFAENSLFKQIQEGNTAATIFFLKCHGKARGYLEKPPVAPSLHLPLDEYKPK